MTSPAFPCFPMTTTLLRPPATLLIKLGMSKKHIRILTVLWAFCIMTAAIIRGYGVGSSLQTTGLEHVIVHCGVFAVLGLLLMLSIDTLTGQVLAAFSGIVLGLGTELYEHFAFHSSMEYVDVLVDTLGVLGGVAGSLICKPFLSRFSVSRQTGAEAHFDQA